MDNFTPPRYGCCEHCEHCADDPSYDANNPTNSHDVWCTIPGCSAGKRAFRGRIPATGPEPTETNGEQRAPVQSPRGTISWGEHEEAHRAYAKRYGNRQDAERIAQRGGFGLSELRILLGREPSTFTPTETNGEQ